VSAFKRGKSGNLSIYVPLPNGRYVQRSTGTSVPSVVRGMKRMVVQIKDEHRWTILTALDTKRVKLSEVYAAHLANRIPDLEARLSSANLSEHLTAWIQWVRANRQADVRTADVYWQQVTTLIVEGTPFPASELTKARVIAWLASRDKASSGTKRKYLYALKSFIRYLNDVGVLALDPLAGLRAPKKNRARARWVTTDVDETIVANAIPQYRAFFAFVKGTGCDVGSARRAQKGDVNLFANRTDIRGTKTDRRAVHSAVIEAWAMPYIREHIKTLRDADRHTLLFPEITNSGAAHHHQRICDTLNVADYTLKDARHSVGVRMRLSGKSFEEIAAQLGTSVFQAVTVYTQYKPEDAERAQEAK
jgi:integrase